MSVSYKNLWKLLIDRGMSKSDLKQASGISSVTLAKLSKSEPVGIIARCREWGLPDPKWQVEDGEDFVMVMPRPQSSVTSSVRTVDWSVDKSVDWSVDKTCDQVLSILKTNPRATLDQVANVVGLSVRGIEQAIKRLKKAKRIRKVGGKRFGHWEVRA